MFIILTAISLLVIGLLAFSGKLFKFGSLRGDIQYRGERTRVFAPLQRCETILYGCIRAHIGATSLRGRGLFHEGRLVLLARRTCWASLSDRPLVLADQAA